MGQVTVAPEQCLLFPDFLAPSAGYHLLDSLQSSVDWQEHSVKLFGRIHKCPRLIAWYGDADARYRYSGITHKPQPWLPELQEIRQLTEDIVGSSFNSVLLNYYRDGDDGMGLHSDDEKELGRKPTIASLSIGATRRFVLQPRGRNKQAGIKLDLPHGSLLLMKNHCQRDWKHGIPKTKMPVGPRINLTFRKVIQ